MNRPLNFVTRLLGDVGTVFYLSILIIAGFVATTALVPEGVGQTAQQILDATSTNVGWMYLLVTSGFVVFTLSLALSKYGSLRLGPEDEAPEFSFNSWIATIFSGGMGGRIGVLGRCGTHDAFQRPAAGHRRPQNR